MKIKIYIVTYNNDEILRRNLDSVVASDLMAEDTEIFIINNYSKIGDFSNYPCTILDNVLRPDHSTAYLSRNWNQAILNGFQDINNPQADLVIAMQNDTEVKPDVCKNLKELHKKYTFVQYGAGDNFMSWKIEAVRRVGLFDERFCGLACQEGDYFIRQAIWNKERACITDHAHKRLCNPTDKVLCIRTHDDIQEVHKKLSQSHHDINNKLYILKWGSRWNWGGELKEHPPQPLINSYMNYPWFEKYIETLEEQRFIHC